MITIHARNVNDALSLGARLVHNRGVREETRNGPALRVPEPVVTIYARPCERVMLQPKRDANPFFHLVEALWMIAGRDDLKCLTPYVGRMKDFSDDGGVTQPAAYGRRWRSWFAFEDGAEGHDQLNWVVKRLRANPNDRRVVIQMWDCPWDNMKSDDGSKDVPCNLTALPWVSPDGRLNLTVFCRSNDMILGAYGANAVHFSFMLEYLAGRLEMEVGQYWQISNNYHAYFEDLRPKEDYWHPDWMPEHDPYVMGEVAAYPIFRHWSTSFAGNSSAQIGPGHDEAREKALQEDLRIFFEHGAVEAATKARGPLIRQVAAPLALAHQHYKTTKGEDRYLGALEILQQCQAEDWQRAAQDWINRRHAKWMAAADDGVQA